MIGSIHPHGAPAVLLIVCLATGAVATSVPGAPDSVSDGTSAPNSGSGLPNILFIIMDDVGIDQLDTYFNPMATDPPATPMIDEIAANGVRFRNFWTMPECSPSRACIFTGRYPFRTGVDAAILNADLPGAQVSPFEVTVPRVLKQAGYQSALIGKFHLGDNNPAGNRSPAALGWDHFNGILPGVPPDIDTTLGGQVAAGPLYSCGFPTGTDVGVCWFMGLDNEPPFCDDNDGRGFTGLECLERGGIPALIPGAGTFARTCEEAGLVPPDFTPTGKPPGNGYYVWPKVIVNAQSPAISRTSRTYMTTDQTDGAIDWILLQQELGTEPWMCTVSYNSAHTPYQPPPGSEGILDCDNSNHALSNLMIQNMDQEISRLLVRTGLAVEGDGDVPTLTLDESNTVVIVVGDNGSYFENVQDPYDPLGAKGTPYQTGVLTPLMIAGPSAIVNEPDRHVDHMVNIVDLFELFGEIAGLDVHGIVPASHVLDSRPVLPYLTHPDTPGIRQFSFTQLGDGLKDPMGAAELGPCVLQVFDIHGESVPTCNDILFISESLCVANGGVWAGSGSDLDATNCCQVCQSEPTTVEPRSVMAITNGIYKLVKQDLPCCVRGSECMLEDDGEQIFSKTYELYKTDGGALVAGGSLDTVADNLLLACPTLFTDAELSKNFTQLRNAMDAMLASEIACAGDGNLDKRVNVQDIAGFVQNRGQPSVFDLNADGLTDHLDLMCILDNFGNVCSADDTGVMCPGINGACWIESKGTGTCMIVTEAECFTLGGSYQGDGKIHCCPCVDPTDPITCPQCPPLPPPGRVTTRATRARNPVAGM